MGNNSLVQIKVKTPPTNFTNRLQTGTTKYIEIDSEGLRRDLKNRVRGEVRFGDADRGMYASDASNYRMVPLGVILPLDAEDVATAVEICRRYRSPIFARGGGTGIPGQTVNNGVLFEFSKYMNNILELNEKERYAHVQPGLVLDTLRNAAEKFHLTFGPDPATHSRCTLGGMIGNNSCGIHSVMAGRTSDNVEELEVLLYDGTRMTVGATSEQQFEQAIAEGGRRGEIYQKLRAFRDKYADLIRKNFPEIPRRVSGLNLPALLPENGSNVAQTLVGSECTLVLVLSAKVRLIPSPAVRSLLVLGYKDIADAADHVIDPMPFEPLAVEALDDSFIEDMKKKGMHPRHLDMMPEGRAWLLIEFGGSSKEESDANAQRLMDKLSSNGKPPMKLFDDPSEEKLVWYLREEGLGATAKIPCEPDNHEGWEDSAVPPEKLGGYVRDLQKLLTKYDYHGSLYGHFGQGCVHTRLNFDLETAEGISRYKSFLEEASDLCVGYGGSLSGEHGDGQARGELLARMFDAEMIEAFREFKQIWDPEWKMNPGKLIDPYAVDENLRLGTDYDPPREKTHFTYPDDHYSFAEASERCVGAGVCRRHGGGTMCPSYMVTFEEKHSTRGRARLLGEMVRGETIHDGWKSDAVKDALDLCLACKGCKGDCPVQVDMATYKAEFLSHFFKHKLRPRTAWTMGRIHRWARMASAAPSLANFFSQMPVAHSIAKVVAGVHPNRTIPRFADHTFKSWFRDRAHRTVKDGSRQKVMLWPDTFNNYFHPQVAEAAVEVLESAGFQVVVPKADLCCGRPLYDWGMLDDAKDHLRQILRTLKGEIESGMPVVVLEPSCASVFKEEMINFFPDNEDVKRLFDQTYMLSGFLEKYGHDLQLPKLDKRALVHGHCHHKAIFKLDLETSVLTKMGLDLQIPEAGCCGMAGAFGFERNHYDISIKCGERVLLPAVRKMNDDDLIITDGFSCHEQIVQCTGRKPLHIAEVLKQALNNGRSGRANSVPG